MERLMDVAQVRPTLKHRLDRGLTEVLLDATHPDCVLPLEHKANPELCLKLSYRFAGHRMQFDLDALRVTLTFKGVEFRCVLPWEAFLYISPAAPSACSPEPEPKSKPNFLRVVKRDDEN